MIISGHTHRSADKLARYLLTAKPGEESFLLEMRDSVRDDLAQALTDWELIGRAKTKGEKVLYHAYLRLPEGEQLENQQWLKAIGDLEAGLHFANQPRAIVAHRGEKGTHLHVVWSRYDESKNILIPTSLDRKQHHLVARAAEKEFGLHQVQNKKLGAPKAKLSSREIRALRDRGMHQDKLARHVQAAWHGTDTGEEFRAMLIGLGIEIHAGDRRDWVITYDYLKMNPVRLLPGVTAAAFRARMAGFDYGEEKYLARENPPAMPFFGRKAKHRAQQQIDLDLSNDEKNKPPKTGFTRKRHKKAWEPSLL